MASRTLAAADLWIGPCPRCSSGSECFGGSCCKLIYQKHDNIQKTKVYSYDSCTYDLRRDDSLNLNKLEQFFQIHP